ncbi:hypothetical protein GSI_07782 [Ganoderma sinense ZZ0214-1]|uniref:Uncharacterized protein n=1 Tax=Ganoderma sinense ZZ0214-1 TaxID=1077348 RepID=A0A2G8S8J6_9APHY|nr:hypothetical protein GSI_07652 [Ganoderma sinense ZZ0214-1]PIL30204.1 hypothetical protein GSI_07782 [Ganoderma sinense ZZ0214-1]
MSYPTLTIDVLEAVIDQASDDAPSLRQLSLLCSTFLNRARYHIFTSIRIRTVQQLESSREFLHSRPWLPPLIKNVTLTIAVSREKSFPNLYLFEVVPVRLLTQLPNLRGWRMVVGQNEERSLSLHRYALSCYRKYCVGIRILHLDRISFDNVSDFKAFILAFTCSLQIESLEIGPYVNISLAECLFDASLATLSNLVLSFYPDRIRNLSERLVPVIVRALSLSPDGRQLVSAGGVSDETLVVWNIHNGVRRAAALEGHTKPATCCDWSFDGTLIASASDDGTVRLWDGLTFELRDVLDDPRAVSQPGNLLLPGDARYLVWVSESSEEDHDCLVWRPLTMEPPLVLPLHPRHLRKLSINALAVDSQCRRITTVHNGYTQELEKHLVQIWDIETGVEVAVLAGHAGEIREVMFAPGGASVLTASQDGFAKIWDAESGRETASLAPSGGDVERARFSPDGRYIATASATAVQLWRTDDLSCIGVLAEYERDPPHAPVVSELAFSLDGEFLGFGGSDGLCHLHPVSPVAPHSSSPQQTRQSQAALWVSSRASGRRDVPGKYAASYMFVWLSDLSNNSLCSAEVRSTYLSVARPDTAFIYRNFSCASRSFFATMQYIHYIHNRLASEPQRPLPAAAFSSVTVVSIIRVAAKVTGG